MHWGNLCEAKEQEVISERIKLLAYKRKPRWERKDKMAFGRKNRKYSKPKKSFDKIRIEEENLLKSKYGLKSKREIWKADSRVERIRSLAKRYIVADEKTKDNFVAKIYSMGFDVKNIEDILALDKEDWLGRRLQSILVKKKLATTPRAARQFIVHKHVVVGSNVVNVPSYLVKREEENNINVLLKFNKENKGDKENDNEKQEERA